MSGYGDLFSEWRRKAKEKAQELDEKYNLSDKVGETVKAAEDALKVGSDIAKDAAKGITDQLPDLTGAVGKAVETARDEFQKIDEEHKLTDNLKRAAEETAKVGADAVRTGVDKASEVAGKAVDVAGKATEAADSAFDTAKRYYSKAETAYDFGKRATSASFTTVDGMRKAKKWIEENPGTAALVGVAAVAGIRLGSAFPGLDRVVFGQSRHWVFHSGLAAYGAKALSEKYFEFLRNQEQLLRDGKLTEAEAERVRFQRKAAKYVGAPLLGAFNIALGATLMSEIFTPGRIVGFPIGIILGGNPVLETVWLFGNGLVCIYNGYELIMFALKDQEDVQRIVREFKALLPPPSDDESKPNAA